MPARLSFALPDALRLVDHATAAPVNLRRPGAPFANTPALRLIVEQRPGQPPVVYLLSTGGRVRRTRPDAAGRLAHRPT
jgi:hypothetical protein